MEEATGTIRVMKHLDRELRPKHTLVIYFQLYHKNFCNKKSFWLEYYLDTNSYQSTNYSLLKRRTSVGCLPLQR